MNAGIKGGEKKGEKHIVKKGMKYPVFNTLHSVTLQHCAEI